MFNTGAALFEALVLAAVSQEDSYGYKITQQVRRVMTVSESTLYPVLRRLQQEGALTAYNVACNNRNRRYYQITPAGVQKLREYQQGWQEYRCVVDSLLLGSPPEEEKA